MAKRWRNVCKSTCAIAPYSGGSISGHRTSKSPLCFSTWSSFPPHLPYSSWFGGIFWRAVHITCVSRPGLPLTEVPWLFCITHFAHQQLFYKTCCSLAVIFASGLGILLNASLASCPGGLTGRIRFPKLGFHSCGLTGFLPAHTEEVRVQQQLNTRFEPQTSQLEQLLRFEAVLFTLANLQHLHLTTLPRLSGCFQIDGVDNTGAELSFCVSDIPLRVVWENGTRTGGVSK